MTGDALPVPNRGGLRRTIPAVAEGHRFADLSEFTGGMRWTTAYIDRSGRIYFVSDACGGLTTLNFGLMPPSAPILTFSESAISAVGSATLNFGLMPPSAPILTFSGSAISLGGVTAIFRED
jgi:hypothetical protein